ncbi:hypothetical protein [Ethanoligenens sp.]
MTGLTRAAVSAFRGSAAHYEKAECGRKPPAGAFPLGEPTGHFAAKRKVS